MHHHRLILNGPARATARLGAALEAAGAIRVASDPPRFIWTTARADPLRPLAAAHPDVVIGAERFAGLGATFERLILQGAETTLLERRAFGSEDEETPTSPPGPARLAVAAPPHLAALRRAALAVGREPTAFGPTTGTTLDDALLVAPALGRLAALAGDPLDADHPPPPVLQALRALGAIGLTIGATGGGAELEFDRAWRLAHAHACASADPFVALEEADWPDWLMFVLSCAAGVIEASAASLHHTPPGTSPIHREHFPTTDEHLDHASTLLTITTIQALALFT